MIYTFRNAQIYTDNKFIKANLIIEDNKIKEISSNIIGQEIKLNSSCIIVPGFIDLHAHFREPGQTYKEDITSGALSALHGGYQTVCIMPNTVPVLDDIEIINQISKKLSKQPVNVQLFSAITKNQAGKQLVDLSQLSNKCIGFSDDGNYLEDTEILKQIANWCEQHNKLLSLHIDTRNKIRDETIIINQKIAKQYNLKGVKPHYEYSNLKKVLKYAIKHNLKCHICHISTKKSVSLIKKAMRINSKITCEVTPHHLLLNASDIKSDNGNYKMNPPLFYKKDQQALIEALNQNIIKVIATDHAPHSENEKTNIKNSLMGIIGLQITFPLLYTYLVKTQKVELNTIINALTINPAKLIEHSDVRLMANNCATFTIIDLDKKQTLTREILKSKSKNTPFIGKQLEGWPIMNVIKGKIYDLRGENFE